jgi:hypothetical protein
MRFSSVSTIVSLTILDRRSAFSVISENEANFLEVNVESLGCARGEAARETLQLAGIDNGLNMVGARRSIFVSGFYMSGLAIIGDMTDQKCGPTVSWKKRKPETCKSYPAHSQPFSALCSSTVPWPRPFSLTLNLYRLNGRL